MLRICPGYRPADGCEPVAQAGALRRPRGTDYGVANFPEVMLAHLSGYQPADGCEPVARAGACAAPGELRA
ncbi:hypothetical protein [Klebsiella oxytoca]|uniref:hypothetical protein n=1 Tax=Klebsiella oxytoca TaxID=571 RepID=UPI002597377B|nr:hypothetical protein [Klebsiella oxytoca]MDM4102309.1 hypothetical protein [Klebsiella oxytoca]MDM4180922.1 hypothetical protein [Klebsiella oxytoca]MDM4198982.1 hypothetical protein [Klebsiella oxytoca]MDM4263339.1 hypothetical protein [Klebsiella oxytoca]MDM4310883.1 hypothetical protein [Klebsiella oxytoca]